MASGHVAEMALVQVVTLPGDDFETVVRSLKLTPSFGPIWYNDVDLGTPSPDVDESRFANDNGVYDGTRYFGSRPISVSLTISDDWFPDVGAESWDQRWNRSSFWVKELGRWTAAGFRSWLWIRFVGDSNPYRIDLSGRGMSAPIAMADRTVRKVQLNFSSPSGLLREFSPDLELSRTSKDGRLRTVVPFGGSEVGGVTFPLTFPVVFPVGGNGLGATIDYDGTISAGLIVRAHAGAGAVVNPKITVTGPLGDVASIGFRGLSIAAGHFLEVNTEAKRLTLDGDPAQPLERYLIGPLRWLKLQPGQNRVTFTLNANADGTDAPDPGAGSYAEALYYPASV
jgi:hypothetical protein